MLITMDPNTKKEQIDEINQLDNKQEDLLKMNRTISVNGIRISVEENDLDQIRNLFKEDVQIDDLQGWQFKETHEPYDFNKFIEKAKEYSDKNPPDIVQFSEKAWGAAAICIKRFFLKHFGIAIKSHSAKSKLLDPICAGLNGKQSKQIADTWSKAEKSHANFYEMNFVTKENRDALLESIKDMAIIIEQADMSIVQSELNNLPSVTIEPTRKESCKIGNESYDFDHVAY